MLKTITTILVATMLSATDAQAQSGCAWQGSNTPNSCQLPPRQLPTKVQNIGPVFWNSCNGGPGDCYQNYIQDQTPAATDNAFIVHTGQRHRDGSNYGPFAFFVRCGGSDGRQDISFEGSHGTISVPLGGPETDPKWRSVYSLWHHVCDRVTQAQTSPFTMQPCYLQRGELTVHGTCRFEQLGGGDFNISTQASGMGGGLWYVSVRVQIKHQLAQGYWGTRRQPIGDLTANGACWENAPFRVRICAWGRDEQQTLPVAIWDTGPPAYQPPVYAQPMPAPVYTPPPVAVPQPAPEQPQPTYVPPAAPPAPVAQLAPAPQPPTPTVAAPVPQPDTGADFNSRPKKPSTKVVDIDIGGDGYSMLTRVRLGSSTYVTALVDTGATNTAIPERIGLELVGKGEASFERLGDVKLADGSTREVSVIRIKEFQVGTYTLHDVLAVLTPNGAQVLLGMSALDQLGPMTIDKGHHQLLFGQSAYLWERQL